MQSVCDMKTYFYFKTKNMKLVQIQSLGEK